MPCVGRRRSPTMGRHDSPRMNIDRRDPIPTRDDVDLLRRPSKPHQQAFSPSMDSTILLVNREIERLFGYDRAGWSAGPWTSWSPRRSVVFIRSCVGATRAIRTRAPWGPVAISMGSARTAPRSRWRSASIRSAPSAACWWWRRWSTSRRGAGSRTSSVNRRRWRRWGRSRAGSHTTSTTSSTASSDTPSSRSAPPVRTAGCSRIC